MASKAKESERQRNERIAGSNNGNTLKTRVVSSKKKYKRNKKVKDAEHE